MTVPATLAFLCLIASPPVEADLDSDGDGLSDLHEVHKYGTDPTRADSDGDGTPDGDWFERREYAYSLRSVVQVAPPVTADVLHDDYQDARILDRGPEHIELEVIHYPLCTIAESITADPDWREHVGVHAEQLRSSTSSNFDEAMQIELRSMLALDGIIVEDLDDVTLVRRVSAWALEHAQHHDLFTAFCAEVGPDGEVRVHPDLEGHVTRKAKAAGLTVAEAFERELFAKDMFANGTRGSCTSSSTYLCGVLRAVGIPTRIVYTIPVIDASDTRELGFLDRLQHARVRETIRRGTERLGKSWASHTYNEVLVGGRWVRLNYNRLGQPTLDENYFGLMTHVATVDDWVEGGFAATVGCRQELRRGAQDIFGSYNAYSCITLSDSFGEHYRGDRGEIVEPEVAATHEIIAAFWWDDPALPAWVHEHVREPRLLLEIGDVDTWKPFKDFTARVDPTFLLEEGEGLVARAIHGTGGLSGYGRYFVIANVDQHEDAREHPVLRVRPRNGVDEYRWVVPDDLTLER